jgi:tetrahydromethanopterin S-methyltransferase subunit B
MNKQAKYMFAGLMVALLIAMCISPIMPALAESTYSLLREILSKATDIKAKTDTIDWADITAIKGWAAPGGILSLIKEKTDLLPPWGDIVTVNLAQVVSSIWDYAVPTTPTAGSFADYIKTIKEAVDTEVATILTDVGTIKSTVTTNLDAKISDVLSGISGLDTKLGAFTATDNLKAVIGDYTAANPLKSAIDSITTNLGNWFGTEGTYSRTTQFRSATYFVTHTTTSTNEEEVLTTSLGKPSQVTISGEIITTSDASATVYVYISADGSTYYQVYSFSTPAAEGKNGWTATVSTPNYIKVTIRAGSTSDSVTLYYAYFQAP